MKMVFLIVSLIFVSFSISYAELIFVKKQIAFFPWAAGRGKHSGTQLETRAEISSFDGKGNIYITDPDAGIKVFSNNGFLLRIVTPPVDLSKTGADISIDGDGSVYYGVKEKIYRVHPDGKISYYENKDGKTKFVRNGKIYSPKLNHNEKYFEIWKDEELKEDEIVDPFFDPSDFSRVTQNGKEYLSIKTEKIKWFLKLHKKNVTLGDETKIEWPKQVHLFTDFHFVGFDMNGRIVAWVSFRKKPEEEIVSEYFYVYSVSTGELLSKITLDGGFIEDSSQGCGADIYGNIYHLQTTEKGAYLYKWSSAK